MFYIKLFELTSDYDNYIQSEDALLPNISLILETSNSHFNPVIKNYLRFVAVEDSSILLSGINMETGKPDKTVDLQYSKNGTLWTQYKFTAIPLSAGETLYLKGNNPNGVSYVDMETGGGRECGFGKGTTGKYECYGNVMSLVYGEDFEDKTTIPSYCFTSLFSDCTGLLTAPELPITNLTEACYGQMFQNCTSLITAPELPATTLATSCYHTMFKGCTSLVNAPLLPATTLAMGCYSGMFTSCTSLVNAPSLPSTTLALHCYQEMFFGCTSLVTAPDLPATTLEMSCYGQMFCDCTSLVTAPELSATTLASNCYQHMFSNCTSLVNAPELPATTLASSCYDHMFEGCTNLNNIVMLANDISASGCLYNWVSGVASSGTFIKHPDMTSLPSGISGIPNGWSVEDYNESNLITFTVVGNEYQAEEGMTWGEWVNKYGDSFDFDIQNEYIYYSLDLTLQPVVNISSQHVHINDIIQKDGIYYAGTGGGAD